MVSICIIISVTWTLSASAWKHLSQRPWHRRREHTFLDIILVIITKIVIVNVIIYHNHQKTSLEDPGTTGESALLDSGVVGRYPGWVKFAWFVCLRILFGGNSSMYSLFFPKFGIGRMSYILFLYNVAVNNSFRWGSWYWIYHHNKTDQIRAPPQEPTRGEDDFQVEPSSSKVFLCFLPWWWWWWWWWWEGDEGW